MTKLDAEFWNSKRVLITGHTGFKGSWMTQWLVNLGAEICGISLEPDNERNIFNQLGLRKKINHYICDIRDEHNLKRIITEFDPEVVFHLAAQPLVRRSYADPLETYNINVVGTANVLNSLVSARSIRTIVNVTTDKVYKNKEWVWGYREEDELGGNDPYSASKACVELISESYAKSFFDPRKVNLFTARAGNVIGGGDWAPDRLVPDIIQKIVNKEAIELRYPNAVRPWQHVLEPIYGYLLLGQLNQTDKIYGRNWNFGPKMESCKTVAEVTNVIINMSKKNRPWISQRGDHPKEAQLLKLDATKANEMLSWYPVLDFAKTIEMCFSWYEAYERNENMALFTDRQIQHFHKLIS